MMDNSAIDLKNCPRLDLSLANLWQTWFKFNKGKKRTREFENFQYYLEDNLQQLYSELNQGLYKHGPYRKFIIQDNKKREINVAKIRDRLVHRLVYDYLVDIYDQTFVYDVWSCRKQKGLIGAINRAQSFLNKRAKHYIWRADLKKFFDNVDHLCLKNILAKKIINAETIFVLNEIINSYAVSSKQGWPKGIPIGNLTSQILANIYLNQLDRYVKEQFKIKEYLRYGDDFVVIAKNKDDLNQKRAAIINFLETELKLAINANNDIVIKARQGLKFLGVWLYPRGRRLNQRNWSRAKEKLNLTNVSSYRGLVKQHGKEKIIEEFNWCLLEKLNSA